jgi:hypothetical protein
MVLCVIYRASSPGSRSMVSIKVRCHLRGIQSLRASDFGLIQDMPPDGHLSKGKLKILTEHGDSSVSRSVSNPQNKTITLSLSFFFPPPFFWLEEKPTPVMNTREDGRSYFWDRLTLSTYRLCYIASLRRLFKRESSWGICNLTRRLTSRKKCVSYHPHRRS